MKRSPALARGRMAASAKLLIPLYELLVRQVLSSKSLHTDGTPVPVLAKDRDCTRQDRLRTYRYDDLHPYAV